MAEWNDWQDEQDEQEIRLTVPEDVTGERIDRYLSAVVEGKSRAFWQKLLKDGQVLVNGKAVKANYQLGAADEIACCLPEMEELLAAEPEDIPLDVVYEDSDIIVVNKARGMVVHPAAGNYHGTLVNALLGHCSDLSGINGVLRPGIVHRIDKETTGLIIAAKNDRAHRGLTEQWHTDAVSRYYLALLHGNMPEPAGTIEAPIGRHPKDRKKMTVLPESGRHAVTHYKVVERFGKYTLVECKLETGRTHQIRVHMKYLGYPLVGDVVYGPKGKSAVPIGMLLHSARLDLTHPISGEQLHLQAALPQDFAEFLEEQRRAQFE